MQSVTSTSTGRAGAIGPTQPSGLRHPAVQHRTSPVPRWRAYRQALVASFAQGRWRLQALEQPDFGDTLIEIDEAPVLR